MELIYFKADIGNFGDDLNEWLWKRFFGDSFLLRPDFDFVGIGSIFDERLESDKLKIIFGTGVRDFLYRPVSFSKYDIRFVRGPISAKAMGGDVKFITDSAYCLSLLPLPKTPKRYEIAYMPYFRHVNRLNWQLFELLTGIKVILPTWKVDRVLEEIRRTERLITSAMHGAIVADTYRVPWIRLRIGVQGHESLLTSELKWTDWLKTMDMKNYIESTCDFSIPQYDSRYSCILNRANLLLLARKMKRIRKFNLSSDAKAMEHLSKLKSEIEAVRDEYSK